MKKKLLITLLLMLLMCILCSCATSRQHRDYGERRGLMLLENEEQPRNKYFYSKQNQKKLKQSSKKYRYKSR
jgi:hypothetical protein